MQQDIWFGKYRILGLLGKGGNCEVYLAEHIKLNSFRAIKFISKNHPLYELQCKEALILKNLKHSCIPIIYDIEENEDGSYIVEQYIEGKTLSSCVKEKGPFHEEEVIRFGLQLCDLIAYLHKSEKPILYMDLKPDNIILSGKTLKLIDFGSALYLDELSADQGYYGTRGYAAPELYRGKKVDERCDVYGIGMLLYYMATGQDSRNNTGINHIDYIGKCSKRLKKIINNCLKFYPSQRFFSVAGLNKELSAMIHKSQIKAESSHAVKVAIAGAQPRIGVTHLALRLCKYIQGQGLTCLYQEKNSSGCIRDILGCYEGLCIREGIHVIEKIPMLPIDQKLKAEESDFDYYIEDYGQLQEDNISAFMEADVKLVILGAKDWELKFAEQSIPMTAEYKDIFYLFNFTGGRQFQKVLSSMEQKHCLRIPYEPDPYADSSLKIESEFLQSLINPEKKQFRKKQKTHRFGGHYET